MRTTTPQRLFLPLVLVLTLLASSSSIIATTDARAVPIKRSPGTDDKDPVYIPPGHDYNPHTPCVWPDQCGGELHTNGGGGGKRQKRSFEPQAQQAQEQPQIEKRNLFSRLFNTERSHHSHHRTSSHKVHYQSYNNIDKDGIDNSEAEEYHYWNVEEQEEGEEEEGIDVEDDMERHSGIYEDVDDDDDEDVGDDDGRAVLFGSASPSTIVRAAGANAPIVTEPFLHPTSLSSLIEDKETGGDQVHEKKEEDNSTAAVAIAAAAGDNNDEDEDMDRIRASQPWYQHPEQYPSSSSASASSRHHTNNILSQIWIVDEWDEDFEGVEEETLDD
ncbi:MAG: hypothetical protein J3R72DRAFT_457577 [Linnemannia gamsii]|nr:MAG: hypothetical protein J3R72DRAFT_457577 [Linnemannia gamsii]